MALLTLAYLVRQNIVPTKWMVVCLFLVPSTSQRRKKARQEMYTMASHTSKLNRGRSFDCQGQYSIDQEYQFEARFFLVCWCEILIFGTHDLRLRSRTQVIYGLALTNSTPLSMFFLRSVNHVSHNFHKVEFQADLTSEAGLEQLLLFLADRTDGVDLLNTIWAKLNLGGEEVDTLVLVQGAVDESALDDALLTLSSLQDTLGESGTSHGHGKSCGTGTILGLDNFVTAKLDALDQCVELCASDV